MGGRNTANMLAAWRVHGFDKALKAALSCGTILTGLSAGSICWFEQGVTDSYGAELQPMDCLGFLSGSNCPHYDGEANRRPAYHRLLKEGMSNGYAADAGQRASSTTESTWQRDLLPPHVGRSRCRSPRRSASTIVVCPYSVLGTQDLTLLLCIDVVYTFWL